MNLAPSHLGYLAAALAMCCFGLAARAQLPAGADRALVQSTCTRCHEVDRVLSQRQDHDGWQTTVSKMQALGLQADAADIHRIVDYLAKSFPADAGPKLNINEATAVELEAEFSLHRRPRQPWSAIASRWAASKPWTT